MDLNKDKEISVNMSLAELISQVEPSNCVSVFKVLHVKYGISYKRMAEALGISPSTFRVGMSNLNFYSIVSDYRMLQGLKQFKSIFLG